MPQLRKLKGNFVIKKYRNPVPSMGHSYYVTAGPEGDMLVWNTDMVPDHIIRACLRWEEEYDEPSGPSVPKLEFNKHA